MRLYVLILASLYLLILSVSAAAQDAIPAVEPGWFTLAMSQGVPAACLAALVLHYLFIESPRKSKAEMATAQALEKLSEKIERCPQQGKGG